MASLIEPERYDLPPKGDLIDFLDGGGQLQQVLDDYAPSATAQLNGHHQNQQRVDQLVREAIMVTPDHMLYPGTYNLTKIETHALESLWYATFNAQPGAQAIRQLRQQLHHLGQTQPAQIAYQRFATANSVHWQPPGQSVHLITKEGVRKPAEPPTGRLLFSPGQPRYPTEIDIEGSAEDYRSYQQVLGLNWQQGCLTMAAWVCTLTGQPAPAIVIKGPSESGKTWTGRYIVAVIDPTVLSVEPEMVERDHRGFVRTGQRQLGVLIDNVTTLKDVSQDLLNKLITGDTQPLRQMYGDVIETIHLQLLIVLTSIAFDPKGDFATRAIPFESLPKNKIEEDDMRAKFDPLLVRVRGFLIKETQRFLQNRQHFIDQPSGHRLGGRVLQALYGEKVTAELAQWLQGERARLFSMSSPWFDALLEIWDSGDRLFTASELANRVSDLSGDRITSKRLYDFIQRQQPSLKDHYFEIVHSREERGSMYHFKPV